MRFLLVDGEPLTSTGINLLLTYTDIKVYAVDVREDGRDVCELYETDHSHLDLSFHNGDGRSNLRQLRFNRIDLPASSRSGDDVTGRALQSAVSMLNHDMQNHGPRKKRAASFQPVPRVEQEHVQVTIKSGQLVVNLDSRTVEAEGQIVDLSMKEYLILELFIMHKGTTVTKEMLLSRLYHGEDVPKSRTLEVFIVRLRQKLSEATNGENFIHTVRGRGYLWLDPPQQSLSKRSKVARTGRRTENTGKPL